MSSIDRPRRPGTALALPDIHPEKDPLRQYLASLPSPRSKAAMRSALKRAARELAVLDGLDEIDVAEVTAESYQWGAPGALSFARVNLAVAKIAATHRPAARLALNALRGVARASLDLGLLGHEDLLRILHVKPPRLSGSQRGRALPGDEVTALYGACAMDPSPRGRRDAALIAVMLGAGLRRFEASSLDVCDYTPGPVFIVRHGKGDKHDRVMAPPDVAGAIGDWLAVRGLAPGPLFPSSGGRGRGLAPGSRLSPSGIYKALLARAEEVGIARTAPHALRRSMITDFLERTGDLALAQRQARHASPATTARYDKRQEGALRRLLAGASTGYKSR